MPQSRVAHTCAMAIGLCFGLGSANQASATVIFDFSLPSNGSVGAFDVQLTFADFPAPGGLQIYALGSPTVASFSSGTPVNVAGSLIGFQVTPTTTLIGLNLQGSPSAVLFTSGYPGDFFVFSRTPTDLGIFSSTSGTVASGLILDTTTPTGTLDVGPAAVPEPSTAALLGLGFLGVVGLYKRRTRSA